jgi:hypothetical protein
LKAYIDTNQKGEEKNMVVYMLREICYERWKISEKPTIKSLKFSRYNRENIAVKHLKAICTNCATGPNGKENPLVTVEMNDDDMTARIIDTTTPVTRVYDYRIIKVDEPDEGIFVSMNTAVIMFSGEGLRYDNNNTDASSV